MMSSFSETKSRWQFPKPNIKRKKKDRVVLSSLVSNNISIRKSIDKMQLAMTNTLARSPIGTSRRDYETKTFTSTQKGCSTPTDNQQQFVYNRKVKLTSNIRTRLKSDRKTCIKELEEGRTKCRSTNSFLDWAKLKVKLLVDAPDPYLKSLKILNIMQLHSQRIKEQFDLLDLRRQHETQQPQDRLGIYQNFTQYCRLALLDEIQTTYGSLQTKIYAEIYEKLKICFMDYMREKMTPQHVELLETALDKNKNSILPANLLEEIGGVTVMNRQFEAIYKMIQDDEYLSKLTTQFPQEKQQLSRYFYFFLTEDRDMLAQKASTINYEFNKPQYYLLKEKIWIAFRYYFGWNITTKLLEGLERFSHRLVLNLPFVEVGSVFKSQKTKYTDMPPTVDSSVIEGVFHDDLLRMKAKWTENADSNPFWMALREDGMKLDDMMRQTGEFLRDSSYAKYHPEEKHNLQYQNQGLTGIKVLEYLMICLFSTHNCIHPSEIFSYLKNPNVHECVPYMWTKALEQVYHSNRKKQKRDLTHLAETICVLRRFFVRLGLYVQFDKA